MQSENRFFDDVVKVINGAAGTVAGMTREAESNFKERMREWIGSQDLVTREEFEAVKAIAVAAREESLELKARLDALEGKGGEGAAKSGGGRGRKAASEGPSPG